MRILPLLLAALPAGCIAATPARPPNVVYILLDDLGYNELSCMGHPEMRTPNIDRLAAEGMRFTSLLAGAPVCGPTRCSLLTGKHSGHMTVRDNLPGASPAANLRGDEFTLGTLFKSAGYATGGFGKWGIGVRGASGVPETHGFDVFFGYYDQIHAHTYFPRYLIRNSVEVPQPGNTGATGGGKTFSQYEIFAETKKFIARNKDRPFFAYCAWTPPHGRWGIPEDDPSWLLYRDKPWRAGQTTDRDARIYAALVNLADREIGEILDQLKAEGIDRDTIVVFSGDNGGQPYFNGKDRPDGIFSPNVDPRTGVRFRGGKGNLYEGGLRVPYIVRWPGKVAGGKVSDHLGYFPDVMPTFAALTGATCPPGLDGISFAPTLTGGTGQREHDHLYWEFQDMVAVRSGDTKAVLDKNKRRNPSGAWAVYDLAKDVGETRDIAATRPEFVARAASIAEKEHTPVRPGAITDAALAAKDQAFAPASKPNPTVPL